MVDRTAVAARLRSEGLQFLRVLWCDNANVIRVKAIHLPSAVRAIARQPEDALLLHLERTLTITAAVQALPVMFDEPVPEAGLEPVREIRLVPDWSTLVSLPYAPGHLQAMANLNMDTDAWKLCPRQFLRRMERRALEFGLTVQTGIEVEFFLFRPQQTSGGLLEPVDTTVYASSVALTESRAVIDQIASSLWGQDIPVANYNPESGPGQHEISLEYTDPLVIADRLVAARETIRAVAHEHGLVASFLPKLFDDETGSGAHMHFSLWSEGRNIIPDRSGASRMSPVARSFIAGVLNHLPSLTAVTTPTPNSFRRLQPHTWSGAFVSWGIDNKEAAVRVLANPFGDGPLRFELKTVDLSANPYVALGSILAAGLDGVSEKRQLTELLQTDPGKLTDAERAQLGISRLPTEPGQALEHFSNNEVLRAAMGATFARICGAVRQAEVRALGGYRLEDEKKLLLSRY